ncbi:apicomplexan specific protein [Cryptosporidium canis]|uniref:Apicomplexan specific protein n=1 Tax=Cryptosporidium canis TaxID=195482 RepID=A0ABQ8PB10_9CRYT|nr:apicomplexan specific protein [Cryptosporidium canis]KAJ1614835.1 apicomplexan specific protein [Cryptosporidium canis]
MVKRDYSETEAAAESGTKEGWELSEMQGGSGGSSSNEVEKGQDSSFRLSTGADLGLSSRSESEKDPSLSSGRKVRNSEVQIDLGQEPKPNSTERDGKVGGSESGDGSGSEDDEEGYEPYIKYLQALSMSWSSCQASSMLTKDLVEYIVPRFQDCSTPIKVRIIMSILYISDSLREACKQEFMGILNFGELDRDDWVRKLSRLMIPFVQKGVLDLGETDTETAFKILRHLDELRMRENVYFRLKPPLESIHMCDPLTDESIHGELPCYNVDYDNFAPQKDFELLLADVEKDGLHKMRTASSSFSYTK